MEELYNDTASRVANELYSMSVAHPEVVQSTKSHHHLDTLAQAMLMSHLIRHLNVRIVSPETLKREWVRLEVLKESAEGNKDYIQGIEDTLNNLFRDIHM